MNRIKIFLLVFISLLLTCTLQNKYAMDDVLALGQSGWSKVPSVVLVSPENIQKMPGDLILVLSDETFISFEYGFPSKGKVLVGIKNQKIFPLTLPNVTRNVIAHELGHAIGLGHNSDPTKLMCGRPASYRPNLFESEQARFFPLSEEEIITLKKMYPPNWKPI